MKRTANKQWKKVHSRRLARRRGYKKTVHGYGDVTKGVVADIETTTDDLPPLPDASTFAAISALMDAHGAPRAKDFYFTVHACDTQLSQKAVFAFVANALSDALERHEDAAPEGLGLTSQDGTLSVLLDI